MVILRVRQNRILAARCGEPCRRLRLLNWAAHDVKNGELGTPEFFGHRLQTSMTRATVEDSTAGLGQILRTGRPLVGGFSFHGVSRTCMHPLAHTGSVRLKSFHSVRSPCWAWPGSQKKNKHSQTHSDIQQNGPTRANFDLW